MKKLVCVFLVLTLLAGCGGAGSTSNTTEPEENITLQVGYSRVDITPEESVPLSGFQNYRGRLSESVTEPLYATCVAFRDAENNTVLLYTLDLGQCYSDEMSIIRVAIAKEIGLPAKQILASATHNHSSPFLDTDEFSEIIRYRQMLKKRMIQAAKDALADLKPARMFITSAYPENLNFVRYYHLSNGKIGSGTLPNGVTRVSHAFEPDNQLQVLKFAREGGKDVLLVNWQGHPHRDSTANTTHISADIIGSMRTYVEQQADCHFAYFTGASGNVNNHSLLKDVTPTKDYLEHGQALGQYAIAAMDSFREVKTGKVRLLNQTYEAESFSNPGSKIQVMMFAFSVGDVAFITAPYEMFDTSGMAIKTGSPFEMTFVATCANMTIGYFPTEFAYDLESSYEASPGSTNVVKGTAEIMEQEYVKMLQELYKLK